MAKVPGGQDLRPCGVRRGGGVLMVREGRAARVAEMLGEDEPAHREIWIREKWVSPSRPRISSTSAPRLAAAVCPAGEGLSPLGLAGMT
jgi:hypothetical protein